MPEFTPLTPPQNYVELVKQMKQMGFGQDNIRRMHNEGEFYKYFDDPTPIPALKKWLLEQKFVVAETTSIVDGVTRQGLRVSI